jgi:hypothetical protein
VRKVSAVILVSDPPRVEKELLRALRNEPEAFLASVWPEDGLPMKKPKY